MRDDKEDNIKSSIELRIKDEERKHGNSEALDWGKIAAAKIYRSFVADQMEYIEYLEDILKEESIEHLDMYQHTGKIMQGRAETIMKKFDNPEDLNEYLNNI